MPAASYYAHAECYDSFKLIPRSEINYPGILWAIPFTNDFRMQYMPIRLDHLNIMKQQFNCMQCVCVCSWGVCLLENDKKMHI